VKKILPLALILPVLFACALPAAAPTEASAPAESAPPFLGMWMNDTETYVFTANSLYHVIIRPESGQVNEEFSEIVAYDAAASRITLRKTWIRVNGKPAGFDAPLYTFIYSASGDSLQLGLGTETEFATELDPAVFTRK